MIFLVRSGLLNLFFAMIMVPYVSADTYNRTHPLGLDYWQPYGRFSADYQTPHIEWAKPLAGGTIKAMVLAPQWTFREAVELGERLDVKITPWMCYSSEELSTNNIDPAFGAFLVSRPFVCQLLEKYLKESFDVYIVGKVNWEILPDKSRFELLKKVSMGAGLVLICPPDNNELNLVLSKHPTDEAKNILHGLPWQSLPRLKNADGAKLVQTAIFGKGRVVKLDYQQPVDKPQKSRIDNGMHSLTPNWVQVRASNIWNKNDAPEQELASYEYYQSLVAKAVCWAAGRANKEQIEIDIPKDIGAQKAAKVQLNITPDNNAIVHTAVRDKFGDVVAEPACADGNLAIAGLSAGDYMLDIWLQNKEGAVLDWGSWAFAVSSDSMIKDIVLANRMFNTGDKVKGTIFIEGTADNVRVELWDNWNRKIDEKQIAIENGQASFDMGPLQPVTTMHQIRAELIYNGKAVSTKQLEFPVRMKQKIDDFSSVIWCDVDNSYPTWAMLRRLYNVDQADSAYTLPGVFWMNFNRTAEMIPSEKVLDVLARNTVRSGLQVSPYNCGFGILGAPKDTHVVAASTNLLSEEMSAKFKKEFTADANIYGPYGTYVWSHGDESLYSENPNVDWGQDALVRFRQEAKSIYGSLEDLNKEWHTSYTDWKEVMPLSFEDAEKTKNYAPWVVHRLSSNGIWAEWYKKVGDFLRVNDPGAHTGFDGGGTLNKPNLGSDWWRLSKNIQLFQSYHAENLQMEIFRSFAPADSVRGLWYGTYGPGWDIGPSTIEYCHYHPWYSLFHSLNSSWFWTNGSPGAISGYAPDMTSLPFMQASTDSLREIKSGIGKLLLASQRQNDKIAIHFSESSRIVECFYQKSNDDWCNGWIEAVLSAARMLEDAGLQYEFVSYEQIENGELEKEGYKVLFMPHSRAVSKLEAERISAFVKNGGAAFADIVPGMHNSAGTQLKESLLKELFPDPNSKAVGFGAGKAVLYGQSWNDYGSLHKSKKPWEKLNGRWSEMANLLSEYAGLAPAIKITGPNIPPSEVIRFDAGGGVEFVGLIRSYFFYDNAEYSATIDFGREGYIYDVRAGKLLGRMQTIPIKLDYQAKLFAVSPYRVDGIDLKADANGIDMTIRTDSKLKPAKHLFHIAVFGPDGKERVWYSQNILAENGKALTNIPFALTDKGEFTVNVRDITSSVAAQVKLKR